MNSKGMPVRLQDIQAYFPKGDRTPSHYKKIHDAVRKFSGGTDMDYARLEKAGLSSSEIKKFNSLWRNYQMGR